MNKRYTVRPLGAAAWGEYDTLEEALRGQAEAVKHGLNRVAIVDEQGTERQCAACGLILYDGKRCYCPGAGEVTETRGRVLSVEIKLPHI